MKGISFTVENEDGEEYEVTLPSKFEVCGRCQGKGSHVNPGVDSHGITEEERENDWSPEEWEGYMNGAYDVTCHECDGLRVVPVVDEAALSEAQQADFKFYLDKLQDDAEYEAECAAERRMGA